MLFYHRHPHPLPLPLFPAPLPEARCATPHHLALTHQLGIEFAAVERKIDVEIHAVESALRRIHALKVFLEILAREIGGESDDFLNA